MADDPLAIDPPAEGRTYQHRRRVQLADGSPSGRLRLDALARMLQDVSDEDTTDAGLPPGETWVVRRTEVLVHEPPVFRDQVAVQTWCSGIGSRWAERRVRIEADPGRGRVDAAVLWVHLAGGTRPARLSERFHDLYATAAGGRTVRARLHHDPAPPPGTPTTPFPLRFSDVDMLEHVNNAVSWQPVEESLAARAHLRGPLRASVEHPSPIDPGAAPEVAVVDVDGGFDLWILVDGVAASTAQVRVV